MDSIEVVKTKLRAKEGLSLKTDEMRLFYGDKELFNAQITKDFNFKPGCVIHLLAHDKFRMPLFIEIPNQRAFELEVESTDTIKSLKIQIERKGGILRDQMKLLYAEKKLDDDKTFRDYHINKGSLLQLEIRIEIFVETLEGKAFTLQVELSDTIESVKNKIAAQENMARDHFQLFFAGKELKNYDTLLNCNIRDRSMLRLVGPRNVSRISVTLTNGEMISVEVDPMDTINQIKRKIQDEKGISSDDVTLIFYGEILRDYQTANECSLSLYYLTTSSNFTIQIFVKTPTGKTFSMDVNPIDKIKIVKTEVQKREYVVMDQIKILFAGKELDDDSTFSHHNIVKASLLHTFVRSRSNIEIAIRFPNAVTEIMNFEPSDTIDNVKVRIQDVKGISTDEICLFFNGAELKDYDKLSDYMTAKEKRPKFKCCRLKKEMNPQPINNVTHSENVIYIYVENLMQKYFRVEIRRSDTVEVLKNKIFYLDGVPTDHQRLIFDGKQLEDDRLWNSA